MPKQKNNRAVAKRFRITKNGKVMRSQASVRHNLTSKSTKRKRKLRGTTTVHPSDKKTIYRLLPV